MKRQDLPHRLCNVRRKGKKHHVTSRGLCFAAPRFLWTLSRQIVSEPSMDATLKFDADLANAKRALLLSGVAYMNNV